MEEILNQITTTAANQHTLFLLLVVFILIDIVTGLLNAIMVKDVNSTKMKSGIIGKVYELSIVAIGMLLDKVFETELIASGLTIFYIAQEGLSILENTGNYISYPKVIKEVFEKLKNKEKVNE